MQCFCGVDSVATCLRCGLRRCGAHYVINLAPSGDAACTKCLESAASVATSERVAAAAAAVSSYILEPSRPKLLALASYERTLSEDQITRVLAVTFKHLTPTLELVRAHLSAEQGAFRRVRVFLTVIDRRPVVDIGLTLILLDSGDAISQHMGRFSASCPASPLGEHVEIAYVAPPGTVPRPEYREGTVYFSGPHFGDLEEWRGKLGGHPSSHVFQMIAEKPWH
jgi:hypothetical protein